MGAQLAALSLTFPKPYANYDSSCIAHFDIFEAALLNLHSIAYPSLVLLGLYRHVSSDCLLLYALRHPRSSDSSKRYLRSVLEIWQEHHHFQVQQPRPLSASEKLTALHAISDLACGLEREILNLSGQNNVPTIVPCQTFCFRWFL
jgi:hypothetical protein